MGLLESAVARQETGARGVLKTATAAAKLDTALARA